MNNYDIVYILKSDPVNEELRYSLRSVEQNFPHKQIWFVGGQPNELKPDHRISMLQTGHTKWERVKNSLKYVIDEKNITDNFWLFNDDFFILKQWTINGNVFCGTIADRVNEIIQNYGKKSEYAEALLRCKELLEAKGCTTYNFAIHCPMLLNKKKLAHVLSEFDSPMLRCLYGNGVAADKVEHKDLKIYEMNRSIPKDADFVSTEDAAFDYGAVGSQLRNIFTQKSRYEL